ncbi:MAG TPA: tetratricopeptide repeat protein [Opitutus sp.]|nr:tetratricopeptide repeat protein [Opitutus sp.]
MTLVPSILERAIQFHRSGDLAAAAALYREVLQTDPNHANALHLLGLATHHAGDPVRAIEYFTKAIAADPAIAPFRLNRGLALRAVGRTADALDDFQTARRLDVGLAEAHHQEGNALKHLGRFADAAGPLRTAVQLAPRHATAWLNLGIACLELRELDEAIRSFRQALLLEPARPEAHNILGHALVLLGNFSEAEAAFNEALRLRSDYAAAHDNLGRLLKAQARLPDAINHFRAALARTPTPATHSNLLLALLFSDAVSPREMFEEHCRWNELHAAPLSSEWSSYPTGSERQQRLRVGYVSPDFINHAVARFIEPVLDSHDRGRFEVFCYSHAATPDAVTARLRALSEHWRDTAQLDDAQIAALVREDRIDLLVDLAGHTAGNQLLAFARKPAPVQITWIGYPNTTGLAAIDYRLTDSIADPPGTTDAFYREELVRLPGPFSCYRPSAESPEVSPLPAAATGHVTFGSFNQFPKLAPCVIELWARILRECPSARLLLRAWSLADKDTAARVRTTFAGFGVDPGRLELNGEQLSIAAHQRCYDRVDIGLDPFPYNGTTTTCEALWMGVPVVTLAGTTHVARVGASLLTHLGTPEWIAQDPDDYVARCIALAADLPKLATIREGLRERFRKSSLGDAHRFTRNLEATYVELWSRHTSSK